MLAPLPEIEQLEKFWDLSVIDQAVDGLSSASFNLTTIIAINLLILSLFRFFLPFFMKTLQW